MGIQCHGIGDEQMGPVLPVKGQMPRRRYGRRRTKIGIRANGQRTPLNFRLSGVIAVAGKIHPPAARDIQLSGSCDSPGIGQIGAFPINAQVTIFDGKRSIRIQRNIRGSARRGKPERTPLRQQ